MGNPTNFLCLKGVLYCFGIISVPDSAFLQRILPCTILPWIMIPVPHIPDTVAWGSHIIVFKFRVLSSGSDLFPWGQPNYTINILKRQMCKFLFFQEFAHSFLIQSIRSSLYIECSVCMVMNFSSGDAVTLSTMLNRIRCGPIISSPTSTRSSPRSPIVAVLTSHLQFKMELCT